MKGHVDRTRKNIRKMITQVNSKSTIVRNTNSKMIVMRNIIEQRKKRNRENLNIKINPKTIKESAVDRRKSIMINMTNRVNSFQIMKVQKVTIRK